jgi:hypothetical protein
MRRFSFLLATGLLVAGLAASSARAGSLVPLPTTLDSFVDSGGVSNGNYTVVVGDETLTFSAWTYSPTALGGAIAPPASAINLKAFVSGNETGFFLTGPLIALSNQVLDVAISYTVTAPKGEFLNDATLTIAGSVGGTGVATVGETLSNGLGLSATVGGPMIDTIGFAPVQTLTVFKDIILTGGANGFASVSIVAQGFSSTVVPEPASLGLLGIGLAGFFTYRRLFKRNAV